MTISFRCFCPEYPKYMRITSSVLSSTHVPQTFSCRIPVVRWVNTDIYTHPVLYWLHLFLGELLKGALIRTGLLSMLMWVGKDQVEGDASSGLAVWVFSLRHEIGLYCDMAKKKKKKIKRSPTRQWERSKKGDGGGQRWRKVVRHKRIWDLKIWVVENQLCLKWWWGRGKATFRTCETVPGAESQGQWQRGRPGKTKRKSGSLQHSMEQGYRICCSGRWGQSGTVCGFERSWAGWRMPGRLCSCEFREGVTNAGFQVRSLAWVASGEIFPLLPNLQGTHHTAGLQSEHKHVSRRPSSKQRFQQCYLLADSWGPFPFLFPGGSKLGWTQYPCIFPVILPTCFTSPRLLGLIPKTTLLWKKKCGEPTWRFGSQRPLLCPASARHWAKRRTFTEKEAVSSCCCLFSRFDCSPDLGSLKATGFSFLLFLSSLSFFLSFSAEINNIPFPSCGWFIKSIALESASSLLLVAWVKDIWNWSVCACSQYCNIWKCICICENDLYWWFFPRRNTT